MAKLYWTKDVRKIIDDEIARRSMLLVVCNEDDSYTDSRELEDLRTCYKFANDILCRMEELDKLDDEMTAAWKAEKEAKDGTDS